MIYYSLQNKITKKLIRVYVATIYEVFYYTFSTIGDAVWLVSKKVAEAVLKTPNYNSKADAGYDTPYNWLECSEWEVVEVTLNTKDPTQTKQKGNKKNV